MGDKTAIGWTDATWNPVTGCSKISPGCANCYAETLAKRLHAMGQKGYTDLPWTPENAERNVFLHPDRLDQPLRWRKPTMVFVNSMSDLFHERVPDWFIAEIFGVMAASWRHTFQVLTKRPERMASLLDSERFWEIVSPLCMTHGEAPPATCHARWLPNVWLGVSIENRRFVGRADVLRETPAAVRFISAEPLLGPLLMDASYILIPGPPGQRAGTTGRLWADGYRGPELDLTDIDWLIVGGESGPGHRPMRLEWVRDLHDACVGTRVARWVDGRNVIRPREPRDMAFFFKQWGGARPKSGGRLLDGRTWDEMPERKAVEA